MSDPVVVTVMFPDGSASAWPSGKQVLVADGVEPLSPTMLGDIVGLLAAAGLLIPCDDSMMLFESTVPREVIEAAQLEMTAFIDALRQRIVDDAG